MWDGCSCSYGDSVCPDYVTGLIKYRATINAWDNKGCDGSDDCINSKPYVITPMFGDQYVGE